MKRKIVKILSGIRPEFDFNQSINFIEAGMLDSFDIVRLVTELDQEFGISIDGMDILSENFASIEKIITLLKNKGVR
jgi:acyl carrier protein